MGHCLKSVMSQINLMPKWRCFNHTPVIKAWSAVFDVLYNRITRSFGIHFHLCLSEAETCRSISTAPYTSQRLTDSTKAWNLIYEMDSTSLMANTCIAGNIVPWTMFVHMSQSAEGIWLRLQVSIRSCINVYACGTEQLTSAGCLELCATLSNRSCQEFQ